MTSPAPPDATAMDASPHDASVAAFIRVALAMLLALGWSVAWYWSSAVEVAGIWWRSETYAHGLIVLPVVAWLAWRARWRMMGLTPQPVWWMSFAVLAAGALWFAGELVAVAAASQAGLVLSVIFGCVALLGLKLARVLLFPLLFMLFAIPIGDFLLPVLMAYTADFTVAALRLSGVPVYQEGLHFVLPNGRWSVVEACSGIRYLIASLLVGALFAYIHYNSLRKRLAFMAFALVMPIVANWVRAYLIVLLGYLSDNEIATGVDHLIYGWVFFGVIIMIMFMVGQRWSDPPREISAACHIVMPTRQLHLLPLLAVAASIAVFPIYRHLSRPDIAPYSISLTTPEGVAGWDVGPAKDSGYRPSFAGARGEIHATYIGPNGEVNLHAYAYANQQRGSEMVAWGNNIIPAARRLNNVVELGVRDTSFGRLRQAIVTNELGRFAVLQWYMVGDDVMVVDQDVKLRLAVESLFGRPDSSMVFVVSVSVDGDDDQPALDRALAFVDLHRSMFHQLFSEVRRKVSE